MNSVHTTNKDNMDMVNSYEDEKRAEAYAKLEFPGTYYLAYRDLPEIISTHVTGRNAIDFGCGTGRSTRFLRNLGFSTVGVDIADEMIRKARESDPGGDYRLVRDGNLGPCHEITCDLVLSVFTFDNIPTMAKKVIIFGQLGSLLTDAGRIVNVVSAPDMYTHEWASFSTKDFPENGFAKSGDKVRIIITAIDDKRPVEDVVWSDEQYHEVYRRAGLEVENTYRSLARENEPYEWINETQIAPWVIYVLKKGR